jgi:HSP20 family protein
METLMERFFGEGDGWGLKEFTPEINLAETDNGYEMTVDLPGMKPEEVTVELKNGGLWISGERKEEKEEKGMTWHRVERRSGEFRRWIQLPGVVDEKKIEASFHDGVLKVTVPKTEEVKPKRIPIKT